jgi:8-oxo-dGTP diphosphatase
MHHSAGGVVCRDGHVVVCSQEGLSWSLPKGRVEKGETVLAAAEREIYEESGVKQLQLIKELPIYERSGLGNPNSRIVMHFFLFYTEQQELQPIDPENPEARWVKKERVADLLTHPKDKEFFQSIIDEIP